MYEHLFQPLSIRGLTLKNRIVLPGIGTKMSVDRQVSDKLIAFHLERVKGGCGLNVLEVASVHAPSAPQGFLGIHDDKCLEGLARLTDAIHRAGGKASIQLWQGGINVMWDESAEVLVPSDFPLGDGIVVSAMSVEKIEEVIAAYGQAARRAVDAGFDTMEFHAAHTYLPHTFLSQAFNHRDDEYGGSLENRMRFSLRAIDAIRNEIPDDMPLFMRIDAYDDFLEGGLTLEETVEFCNTAKVHGVDVVNVSRGNTVSDGLQYEVPPIDLPRGINVENASKIKEKTGMLVQVAGRINTPDHAERIIARGACDLVGIARGQIADPLFAQKAAEEQDDRIVYCIGCNQGCYDAFTDFSKDHISCLRNPAVGRESEIDLSLVENPQRILVAGGGVGGMEAALSLNARGHEVVLAEKEGHLGGRFAVASCSPRKGEMLRCCKEMANAVLASDIEVKLETDALSLANDEEFDEVICAIGASPVIPPIAGIDSGWVYLAEDVLLGEGIVSGKVVVIGGGLVGLEVAEYCAQQGCEVVIVEMADTIGNGLGDLRRICVNQAIAELGIKIECNTKVLAISDAGVEVQTPSGDKTILADYVVLAVGYMSEDSAEFLAAYEGKAEVICIGDALSPRKALDAIHEGFELSQMAAIS